MSAASLGRLGLLVLVLSVVLAAPAVTHAQRPTVAAPALATVPSGPAPANFRFTELEGNKVHVAWDAIPGATLYRIRRRRSEHDTNPLVTSVLQPKFIDNTSGLPPNFPIIYEVTSENPTQGSGSATATFRTRDVHPSEFEARMLPDKSVRFNWRYPTLSGPIKHFWLAGANGAPSTLVPASQSYWTAKLPAGTYTYTLLMYFDAPGGVHESNVATAPRVTVTVP